MINSIHEREEMSAEETKLRKLSIAHLLFLVTLFSIVLAVFSTPSNTFEYRRYDEDGILIASMPFADNVFVTVLCLASLTFRFTLLRIDLSKIEHFAMFFTGVGVSLVLIYWKIVPWHNGLVPDFGSWQSRWIGYPVGLLAVPVVSFLVFDLRRRLVEPRQFVKRSMIESLLCLPVWWVLWSILGLILNWSGS